MLRLELSTNCVHETMFNESTSQSFKFQAIPGHSLVYLIFSSILTALVLVFTVLRLWWKRKTEKRDLKAKKKGLRSVVKAELDGSIPLGLMASSVDLKNSSWLAYHVFLLCLSLGTACLLIR
jgi:hypothetical protein